MFKVKYDFYDESGDWQRGTIGFADVFHPHFYEYNGDYYVRYWDTGILFTKNKKLAERVVELIEKRHKNYEHYRLPEDVVDVPKIVENFSKEIETVAEYDEIIGGTLEHMSEVDR